MLQEWCDQQRLEFDFIVGEVSFESATSEPSERSVLLVHLFKQLGFQVADCDYWQPMLGPTQYQSDVRAHLIIASREAVPTIRRQALLLIVRTIYFDHYARWYQPFLIGDEDQQQYSESLVSRYTEFERSLPSVEIRLNGAKMLHPPNLPSKPPRAKRRLRMISPLAVATGIGIFTAGFLILQHYFPIQANILIILFSAALITFVVAFALFEKRALDVLSPLLNIAERLFRKPK